MKRAIIYCRTASTLEGSDFSLAVQAERCRTYCQQHGYEVAAVTTDAGQGGHTLDRPGLVQVRDLAATGQIAAIVVTSLHRLTRRADQWITLYDEFTQAGVIVLVVNGAEANDALGQLINGIYELFIGGISAAVITRHLNGNGKA